MNRLYYIQLILPVKLAWEPWYSHTAELDIGQRVFVRFAGRMYVAVVYRTAAHPGISEAKVKPISSVIEYLPKVSASEFKLWEFISGYYMCSLGEVYKMACPAVRMLKEMTGAVRKAVETSSGLSSPVDVPQSPLLSRPLLAVSPDNLPHYVEAARETIDTGRSVLVLVPEVRTAERLKTALAGEFADKLILYSTRTAAVRQKALTDRVRSASEPLVVLGTRKALFLPWHNLGLVIVEEEQSPSYKQNEPAPRYNARDVAAVLSHIHGASLILGSSCPSLESLYNTVSGKYELEFRPCDTPVELIDMAAEKRKKGVNGAFSYQLLQALRSASGSVLLVRGFENEQQLGEQISALGIKCTVMTPFAACATGGHYDTVAVLSAEALFSTDDFRSDEKTLQTLSILSARCSRMVIQSANPVHPVFGMLISHELPYALLEERKAFHMPPYTRIVDVKSPSGGTLHRAVLDRGPGLSDAKSGLSAEYPSAGYFDVDPL